MGELRDRYVRFDWAIKRLLRQKANFDVLEGFLSVFLGEPILIEEILASENSLYTPGDRVYGLGVKAQDSKKDPIVIDIRFMRELYYWERVLYKQKNRLKSASWLKSCKQVKKIYSMIILYFPVGDGSDYLYYSCRCPPGRLHALHQSLNLQALSLFRFLLPPEERQLLPHWYGPGPGFQWQEPSVPGGHRFRTGGFRKHTFRLWKKRFP